MKSKVTGWTHWNDKRFEEPSTNNKWKKFKQLVIQEIRDKGYRFSGYYHQQGDFGVPVIDGKYRFEVSMRTWGKVMAEAEGNFGDMDYVKWAWDAPEKEVYPGDEH